MSFLVKDWICIIFLHIFVNHQRVASQNRHSLPSGSESLATLAGLDVGILREIAAALNIPGLTQQPTIENAPVPSVNSPVNPTQGNWYQSAPQTGTQTDTTMFSGGMVSPSCTGKGGSFPDYTQGCRIYYRCSPDGRMARFECPLNYIFSEQLRKCDVPELVTCGVNSQKPVHTPFVNHQSSHSLGSNPTAWPTLTHNENGGGLYESLLGAVTERFEGYGQPAIKIMGDPHAVLDVDPMMCFGRPNMYIADPDTGCRGYIKCPATHTTPFRTFICPSGMRFDVKSEQCLPRGQVRCADVEPLLPPGFGLAGTGLGFDIVPRSGLANPRSTTAAVRELTSPCHGKTGFVPDYQQQCQVYFYCNADGTALNLTCPAEMVFSPALQSCDFFQTAPECRTPVPTPQKMKPVEPTSARAGDHSKTLVRVLTMTDEQMSRTVTSPPFMQMASSKRSNPGVEAKYARKTPSLLMEHPNDAIRHNSYERRVKLSPQSDPIINKMLLEGFLTPELMALPMRREGQNNNINTGNTAKIGQPVHAMPVQHAGNTGPRRHLLPSPGTTAPVTMYEVECDGNQGYFIEPESGCRIFHFCHPNMTLDTYSCPPTEVFVTRSKSCVSQGAAICIDPVSNDARDILQRIWNPPSVAAVSEPTVTSTVLPLDSSTGESGAQSTSAPILETLCTAGIPGTFADASSHCVKYIECQTDGSFVAHSCPMNLRFNANLKACDWPQYVNARCNEIKLSVLSRG